MLDYKNLPDEDLYGMCLAGDEDAWKYLYNYILKICEWWRISYPEDMASKVTEELLKGRIGTLRKKDRFRYFVKLLTQSRIKDYLKSAQRREVSIYKSSKDSNDEEIERQECRSKPDQIERLNCMEVMSIVDQAVEKLSEICRRVIREYLKFKIGLYEDYRELSQVLGMSVPNISSRVTRCMKILVGFKEIESLRELIIPD
ncbi:MAG: hypothetical protein BWK74_05275 [Desulfobacteraceae bacterium A6]|nr:MAG: hypothetical protein BWK74_05275 [Desulfobacteraceae bacterium A6]